MKFLSSRGAERGGIFWNVLVLGHECRTKDPSLPLVMTTELALVMTTAFQGL